VDSPLCGYMSQRFGGDFSYQGAELGGLRWEVDEMELAQVKTKISCHDTGIEAARLLGGKLAKRRS